MSEITTTADKPVAKVSAPKAVTGDEPFKVDKVKIDKIKTAATVTVKTQDAKPEVVIPTTKAFEAFAELASALAAADLNARVKGDDSKQAAAARASLATDALKAAVKSKADGEAIRKTLADAGVLKGTASKIVTVVVAVAAGQIDPGEFKTLYEGYSKVSLANRVAAVNAFNANAAKNGKPLKPVPGTSKEQPPVPIIKEVDRVVMPHPKDALQVILDDIKNAGDDDMILDRAAFWVGELTSKITGITSKIGAVND